MRASFIQIIGIPSGSFAKGITTPILMFIVAWMFTSCCYFQSKEFDSNKWKNEVECRYKMVENIIDSKLLIGMHKKEVIELLGSDIEEGPCDNCIGYSTNSPEQVGYSIDHEVLVIDFDNQNKVIYVGTNDW